jgi:hypothetical protein
MLLAAFEQDGIPCRKLVRHEPVLEMDPFEVLKVLHISRDENQTVHVRHSGNLPVGEGRRDT